MTGLLLLFASVPYLVAALLGLLLPALFVGAYSRFGIGLWVVGFAWVLDNLMLSRPLARIGITLYPPDLPLILLGAVAALRWLVSPDVPRRWRSWLLLALWFMLDLAIGLARHGSVAGVQARPDYYAVAVASYAMSFEMTPGRVRQMLRSFLVLSLITVGITVYRWVVYYTPIPDLLPPGGVYNPDGASRVIGSGFTLLLAQVAVLGLFFAGRQEAGFGARLLAPLMLAAVIGLQHRSVWLATLVGGLMCLVLARAQRAPLWQQLTVAVLTLAAAAAPVMLSDTLQNQVGSSAARALEGSGTVDARFANWRATLQQWVGDGPRAIVMGRELGSDTTRYIESDTGSTQRIQFGAHNQYITQLTSFGVVGLTAMLVVFAIAVRRLWAMTERRDERATLSALLLALLGMQLAYYVAYAVDFMQYLVLGVALAWVARPAPQTTEAGAGVAGADAARRPARPGWQRGGAKPGAKAWGVGVKARAEAPARRQQA